jgi:hypothetical protein
VKRWYPTATLHDVTSLKTSNKVCFRGEKNLRADKFIEPRIQNTKAMDTEILLEVTHLLLIHYKIRITLRNVNKAWIQI